VFLLKVLIEQRQRIIPEVDDRHFSSASSGTFGRDPHQPVVPGFVPGTSGEGKDPWFRHIHSLLVSELAGYVR
jgi:hypothetical protein